MLSALSLGMWHNFGSTDSYENMRNMVFTAFDNGINVFDTANNYGPVIGAAERNFGSILARDLKKYRDEMIVTTKAGFPAWKGPCGKGGGLKYLTASLDRSLQNLGLEYVDIFYHHRPDPETPLEETAVRDAPHRGERQGAVHRHLQLRGGARRKDVRPAPRGKGAVCARPGQLFHL